MPRLGWGEIDRCLTNKLGCELVQGARHRKYKLVEGGKVISWTLMSRSRREVGANLVSRMAGQLKVSTLTFVNAVNCTASRDEVVEEAARATVL